MNPDAYFVCIGAQKAGTTWLAAHLDQHPDAWVSPVKELHVFDRLLRPDISSWLDERFAATLEDMRRRAAAGRQIRHPERLSVLQAMLDMPASKDLDLTAAAYREFFANRVGDQRAFGELCPAYALLPEAGFTALLSAFPRARFVYLLREPVARYWSQLRHERRFRADFDPEAAFLSLLDEPGFGEHSDYGPVLQRLLACIPHNQICVVFYEHLLVERRRETLTELSQFLGIRDLDGIVDQVVYPGEAQALPKELSRSGAERFAASYDAVASFMGTLPESWECARSSR